jgi:threonine/homoserine/homoserine lactone efflux protein
MFGLSAGFAPGPLLALVISQTLQHNVREGVLVAAAPILTDVPIILVAFFVLKEVSNFEFALGLVAAVGGCYLLYLSYETLRTGPVSLEIAVIQPSSLKKGALVNALNPHPYLFWASVGVPFVVKTLREDPITPWLFIISFYCFLVGSKVLIALTVSGSREFLRGKLYLYTMRGLGIVLGGFAIVLLWDALVHFGVVSG